MKRVLSQFSVGLALTGCTPHQQCEVSEIFGGADAAACAAAGREVDAIGDGGSACAWYRATQSDWHWCAVSVAETGSASCYKHHRNDNDAFNVCVFGVDYEGASLEAWTAGMPLPPEIAEQIELKCEIAMGRNFEGCVRREERAAREELVRLKTEMKSGTSTVPAAHRP